MGVVKLMEQTWKPDFKNGMVSITKLIGRGGGWRDRVGQEHPDAAVPPGVRPDRRQPKDRHHAAAPRRGRLGRAGTCECDLNLRY